MPDPTPTPAPRYNPLDPTSGGTPVNTAAPTAPSTNLPPIGLPNQPDEPDTGGGAAGVVDSQGNTVIDGGTFGDYNLKRDRTYWEQLYKAHVITRDELKTHLTNDVHLSPGNADNIAKLNDAEIAKGNGLSAGEIQQMMKRGIFGTGEAAQQKALALFSETHNPEAAKYLLDLANKGNLRDVQEGDISKMLADGQLDAAGAAQRLQTLGYNPQDAQALVKSMQTKTAKEGESVVASLVKEGKITQSDALGRLQQMGYSARDAQDLLTTSGVGGVTPTTINDYNGVNAAKANNYYGAGGPPVVTTQKGAEGIQDTGASPINKQPVIVPDHHSAAGETGGRAASGGGGSAPNLAADYTKAYENAIGDMFHQGAINPLAAHWALGNQDVFFAKHLGNGGDPNNMLLPSAGEINLMYQGMQYAPRQRNTDANVAPVAQEPV